jgi:hypothetical protein
VISSAARGRLLILVALPFISPPVGFAQQGHDTVAPNSHEQHAMPAMTHGMFPSREASGTAWVPDETPMYGVERRLGDWHMMVHGTAFAQFLYEPGDRHRTGGFANEQFSAVNWLMLAARRPAGAGRVGLRGMVSIEPWTVGDCGFINLLATGESCEGDSIHDRQHPHDLFMELAAEYDGPVRGSLRWQVYGGLSGEPALGPAAFPHRASAMPNPIAPITHHWLDSSHITFGVVTTALYDQHWKAEVSLFNGREPDEQRADFDLGPLDSFSGRLTFLPTRRWALQLSAGHLEAAEAEFPPEPRSDKDRVTASATYHRASDTGLWATTIAYGVNAGPEVIPGDAVDLVTHAVLAESSFSRHERHMWFGRIEIVGKPGHDLHVHDTPAEVFTVGKLQAGYTRYLRPWKGAVAGIGGTAALSIVPPEIAPLYSGRVAPGLGVFLTVRASRHVM